MPTPLLQQIARTLPTPTPADLTAVFSSADPNTFAARGRQVASSRVLTDASRLYGLAASFWEQATEAQRRLLVGFSDALLAVAVTTALELDQRFDEHETHRKRDRTTREVTAAELGDAWTTAIRRRDLAVRALALVAGRDASRESRLAAAAGHAESADDLARGLDDLAALARAWVADPALADIVRIVRLDSAFADHLAANASELRSAADAAKARMSVRVTQGDLDVLDGKNLYLLKQIIDLFAKAHDIDPAIPRLVPIALHSVLYKRRSRRASSATVPLSCAEVGPPVCGEDLPACGDELPLRGDGPSVVR